MSCQGRTEKILNMYARVIHAVNHPLLFCRPILSEGDSEDDVLSGEDREDIVVSNEPHVRLSDTRGKSVGDMPNDDTHDVNQGKNEFDTRISAFQAANLVKLKPTCSVKLKN